RISLNPSTRRSPRAWAWACLSPVRLSKPMVGGCGRPGASRGVLSFSLRSPLTEPLSVIDVAYWRTLPGALHMSPRCRFGPVAMPAPALGQRVFFLWFQDGISFDITQKWHEAGFEANGCDCGIRHATTSKDSTTRICD